MLFIAYNTKELILMYLSIVAELPKETPFKDIKQNTYAQTVATMKTCGIVSTRSGNIRLKRPKGTAALHELSPSLSSYFETTTSKTLEGNKKNAELRNRRMHTLLFMLQNEIPVDDYRIIYRSNSLGVHNDLVKNGNTLPDSLSHRIFLRKKFVVQGQKQSSSNRQKIQMSHFIGQLLSEGNSYLTYYIDPDKDEICTYASESIAKLYLMRTHEEMYGPESLRAELNRHKNGNILCLTDQESNIPALCRSGKHKRALRPANLSDDFYILPTNENGKYALSILCHRDWEKYIPAILYGENMILTSTCYNGKKNGIPSCEFLTCNFGKIFKILRNGEKKINIICYEWQQEIIESLLPYNEIEFSFVTERDLAKIKSWLTAAGKEEANG